MTTDLQPYPAYKPSGIDWLGDIPAHWDVRRLRNLADMRASNVDKHIKDGELPVRLCNYVDVYKNDRITDCISFMRATATEREIARLKLQQHDVLITKDSETWNDIGVPALVEYAADDLVCGYHLAVLRPLNSSIDGRYLFRALQSPSVSGQFQVSANGVTRYGLSHGAIKSVQLPVPPLAEQAAIARYLDRADERIRRAIDAKRRLVELLTEQRQAVIHRAVTRGLDAGAPLKASGVEWLGDVPAHWDVMPIKRAFASMDYGISESASDSGTIRLLTMGHISQGRVTVPHTGGVNSVPESLLLRKGDLLFNRTNSQELVGKVGLFAGYPTPVTFASYLVRLRPNSRNKSEYLNAVLNDVAVLSHIRREAIPSLHQSNLNPTRYGRIKVPLPPLNEQASILEHLEKATAAIDAAIANAERQVELLGEYRARLVADVVCGRVDVRDMA